MSDDNLTLVSEKRLRAYVKIAAKLQIYRDQSHDFDSEAEIDPKLRAAFDALTELGRP